MANVRINRRTNRGRWGGLPPLCVRCGQPAEVTNEHTFYWAPGWVYILMLFGLLAWPALIAFLVALLLTLKSARLSLPLCKRHERPWLFRNLVLYGGLGLVGFVFFGGLIALFIVEKMSPSGGNWFLGGCGAFGLLALAWLFSAIIVEIYSLRAGEITEKTMTLVGVSPTFRAVVIETRQPVLVASLADDQVGPLSPAPEFENPAFPESQKAQRAGSLTKLCPYCSEEIKATAIKCRYCDEFLEE